MPDLAEMTVLEGLRGASLTIWALACIGTTMPFLRHMRNSIKHDDEWWAFAFMVSVVFVSWGMRNVLTPTHPVGASYSSACAAQVLTLLLGLSVLRKRVKRLGWDF